MTTKRNIEDQVRDLKNKPAEDSWVRVVSIAPNPKKVGSATHGRYTIWQVGMTKADALAAGLTRADIAYDVKKGFVRFAL